MILPSDASSDCRFVASFFQKAEVIFNQYYEEARQSFVTKEDATPVTKADIAINDLLIEMVQQSYPSHGIDGEERSVSNDSPYVWVCDPIDGTMPYTDGVPLSAISVALTKDGKSIMAATYEVHSKRLTCAELGKGTFCNGKRIYVHRDPLGKNLRAGIIFDSWPSESYSITSPVVSLSADTRSYVRSFGCAVAGALMVARGCATVHIFSGGVGKHVDVAATSLLVTEAGGKATDLYGDEQTYDGKMPIRGSILSNGVEHERVVSYLRQSQHIAP